MECSPDAYDRTAFMKPGYHDPAWLGMRSLTGRLQRRDACPHPVLRIAGQLPRSLRLRHLEALLPDCSLDSRHMLGVLPGQDVEFQQSRLHFSGTCKSRGPGQSHA